MKIVKRIIETHQGNSNEETKEIITELSEYSVNGTLYIKERRTENGVIIFDASYPANSIEAKHHGLHREHNEGVTTRYLPGQPGVLEYSKIHGADH